MIRTFLAPCNWMICLIMVSACTEAQLSPAGGNDAPPGAAEGTCWHKTVTPAIVESVTHQREVSPARLNDDGTVQKPAVYKTETLQEIVRDRQVSWFETPCQDVLTPEFISSVQRALAARDLYTGEISGKLDSETRAAIRSYQTPLGIDNTVLSLEAARKLGLVAVERDS